MARQLRVEYEGALYHVTFRGVERRNLFRGDGDRQRLLLKLEEGVERFELDVYLYCLMSNHVHLLVGTPRGNLGQFMGWWQTAYAVYFNRKYQRSGHLTQGRYGAKLVEGDAYLLSLSRYIHLNPVTTAAWRGTSPAERMEGLQLYPWSSLRGYCSARKAESFVRYEPLLELVGQGRKNLRRAYRNYVEKGLEGAREEWEELQSKSRLAIGSSAFIETVDEMYDGLVAGRSRLEDVSLRRVVHTADPEHVLPAVAEGFGLSVDDLKRRRRNATDRAVAAYLLVTRCGLSQREAAGYLNVTSGVAIGAQLKTYREQLSKSRSFRSKVKKVEQRLRIKRA